VTERIARQLYEGACLCGAVRFTITGPAKWVAYCHCTMCRRAHGAGAVAWAGFAKTQVVIGERATDPTLARYQSSATAHREFCSRCGSPLFFLGERWPDERHVALAAIKEPHDLVPRAHAYFDDRASWVHVDDGLKRAGGPNGNTPRA
jgi:hypothetical protein